MTQSNPIPDQIPEKLSFDYRFIEKIGEGSNGETWLAENHFTGLKAAIKCLKLNKVEDVKTLELFNRESELLKSVKVDGVPQFYDYYPPENGQNGYLVQEYIQAQSIQTMMDNGERFTESRVLEIAERIAEILFHLETEYQPPIIHRDIKPSNILYRQSDGMVYIIDFGSVANPQKRTGGSTVAGTFGYMPPEQIMGDIAIQSDYYALGATILHMITGIPPYQLESDGFRINIKQALKERNIKVSNTLIQLLSSLLSPEIEKRPPNPVELMNAIRMVKDHKIARPQNGQSIIKILRSILGWLIPVGLRQKTKQQSIEKSKYYKSLLTINSIERQYPDNKAYTCRFETRNWQRCDGILRKNTLFTFVKLEIKQSVPTYQNKYVLFSPYIKKKQDVTGIEYTFEVNGHVWSGFCAGTDSRISFPRKCSVLYNPNDPRENALEFIYDTTWILRPNMTMLE